MTSGKNVGCQIQIRTTKVRFEKNRMYTSDGAIDIKYEKKKKKMHTDLYIIKRPVYIPTVKGFYWKIGKD